MHPRLQFPNNVTNSKCLASRKALPLHIEVPLSPFAFRGRKGNGKYPSRKLSRVRRAAGCGAAVEHAELDHQQRPKPPAASPKRFRMVICFNTQGSQDTTVNSAILACGERSRIRTPKFEAVTQANLTSVRSPQFFAFLCPQNNARWIGPKFKSQIHYRVRRRHRRAVEH
jgi:hypothetical protein